MRRFKILQNCDDRCAKLQNFNPQICMSNLKLERLKFCDKTNKADIVACVELINNSTILLLQIYKKYLELICLFLEYGIRSQSPWAHKCIF